jgi:hypothetical protein
VLRHGRPEVVQRELHVLSDRGLLAALLGSHLPIAFAGEEALDRRPLRRSEGGQQLNHPLVAVVRARVESVIGPDG